MPSFQLLLVITNKEAARDPEGETLTHELKARGYRCLIGIRAGKSYVLDIDANNADEAIRLVKELASETRLYNPIVHDLRVLLLAENSGGKISRD